MENGVSDAEVGERKTRKRPVSGAKTREKQGRGRLMHPRQGAFERS